MIDWGNDKNTLGVIPVRSGKGWLGELLGVEEEDAADLLQATGLQVGLGAKGAQH